MTTEKIINLPAISKRFKQLKSIKVCLFDVDGVLTDGRLFYTGKEVGFNRFFHTQDGYGMKILQEAGLKVGIITGGNSLGVHKRFKSLGVDYFYAGSSDKRKFYREVLKSSGVEDKNIMYIGDEFFDLPILKRVGFSCTVPHASYEIRKSVDYVTVRSAGMGAAREVIDLIRHAQGITPKIEDF